MLREHVEDADDDLRVLAVLDALAEVEQTGLQRLGDVLENGDDRADDSRLQRLRTLLRVRERGHFNAAQDGAEEGQDRGVLLGVLGRQRQQRLHDLPAVAERVRKRIQKAEQPSVTIAFTVSKHKDNSRRGSQTGQHADMLPLDACHQQHTAGDQRNSKSG